jgi:excisionase family DNA binding protein
MGYLSSLTPEALAELVALVDERVAEALAERDCEPQKRWLNVKEAGIYLGCSDRAVHQRIRRGRIPTGAVKHSGRSLLIDRLALDRLLERT